LPPVDNRPRQTSQQPRHKTFPSELLHAVNPECFQGNNGFCDGVGVSNRPGRDGAFAGLKFFASAPLP